MTDAVRPRFHENVGLKPRVATRATAFAFGAAVLFSIYAGYTRTAWPLAVTALVSAALLALRSAFEAPHEDATVRVAEEIVLVTRKPRGNHTPPQQRIPRASIASGFFRPLTKRGYVVLRDASGNTLLEVAVRDEAQAVALLEALDLDAAKRLLPIDVASPITALTGRAGGVVIGLAGLLGLGAGSLAVGITPMFALGVMTVAMLIGAWPGRVEIAADGVSIAWLTRRRFVRFSELRSVTQIGRGASLLLASGEKVLLPRAVAEPGTDAMVARLREALDVHRSASEGAASATLALVGRGDRTASSWLEHLRALRGEGYRTAAMRDDDLWRVVEDPSADADARAGAVLLLRPTLDDAGRGRIRVASEATASPKLRVLLDAAAEPEAEDEAVEKHLAMLALEE